jgi:TonB family protein
MRRARCSALLYLALTLSMWLTHSVAARDVRQKSAAKHHFITGSGRILIEVEPKSGRVIHVRMAKSTGNAILDEAAVNSFLKAHFKPGTAPRFEVPISFRLKVNE